MIVISVNASLGTFLLLDCDLDYLVSGGQVWHNAIVLLESSMNYLCPDAAGKLLPTVLGVDLRGHRGHDLRDLQDEILLCQACFQNTQTFKPAHLHTSNKTPLYFQVKYFGRLGDT